MIRTSSMRPRQGFTLIELLVATGVFMLGFTAAFSLFLAAMRYRVLADDTTKLSLAASSLVEELAIGNPATTTAKEPFKYLGSGDLPVSPAPSTTNAGEFTPYAGVPGTWFTVESCTDLLGDPNNASTPTLHLNLVVLVDTQSPPDRTLDLTMLNKRLRLVPPASGNSWNYPPDPVLALDALVKRGLAMRVTTVVVRRPHWM